MEPKAGLTLNQMWINAEADIAQKTSRSNEIRDSDLRRVAFAVTFLPTPQMADSPFLKALGTPTIRTAPAQTEQPKGQLKNGKTSPVLGGVVPCSHATQGGVKP